MNKINSIINMNNIKIILFEQQMQGILVKKNTNKQRS